MNPLLKLLVNNRGRGFFRAESKSNDEATVYVYDVIVSDPFWGGVDAQSFVKEIASITAPVIHLRINSPGGDVFAARAMEQAIRDQRAKVIAHVDGYAASAASFLAMGADEVEIAPGGFFMIHKAWAFGLGNSEDFLQLAALLEKIDESLVQTYAQETGQESAQIRDWMAAETWFDAEEAVKNGFADRIMQGADKEAAAQWDMSAYGKAPKIEQAPLAPAAQRNTDHLKRRLQVVARSA